MLLTGYDRRRLVEERWQLKHPELWDTIKKGYAVVENIMLKRVGYKNSVGSIFLLKASFGLRENAIVNENERIVINIGSNNGTNKIK